MIEGPVFAFFPLGIVENNELPQTVTPPLGVAFVRPGEEAALTLYMGQVTVDTHHWPHRVAIAHNGHPTIDMLSLEAWRDNGNSRLPPDAEPITLPDGRLFTSSTELILDGPITRVLGSQGGEAYALVRIDGDEIPTESIAIEALTGTVFAAEEPTVLTSLTSFLAHRQ